MVRGVTAGRQIEAVRIIRGETQKQFAQVLRVTQGAVSAWERDDKKRTPSADVFVRLADLAPDPTSALAFLELAGINARKIVSIAKKVEERPIVELAPDKCIPIHRVRIVPEGFKASTPGLAAQEGASIPKYATEFRYEKAGPDLLVQRVLVPNPVASFCYVPSLSAERSSAYLPIVDGVDGKPQDLSPFLGQLVLAQHRPYYGREDADPDFGGPHVGYLYLKSEEVNPSPRQGQPWTVRFLSQSVERPRWEHSVVGGWTEPWDWDEKAKPVAQQVRLYYEFVIFGRVVAWWPAAKTLGDTK